MEGFAPLNKNLDISKPEKLKLSASGSVTYKGTKKIGNVNSIVDSIVNAVKDLFLPSAQPKSDAGEDK